MNNTKKMNIGILGTGHIGKTLARKLSAAGHDVKVANSRGPETIEADVLALGARAVSTAQAVEDVDVVILSIPLNRIPTIAPLIANLPAETVVIDTSNYYPHRDGKIDAMEAGQVESLWVAQQLGRPIAKAWNAIGSGSFATKGKPAGSPDRIALPVAADRENDRSVAMPSSKTPGLMLSTRARSPIRGVSNQARPAIAPISRVNRWRQRWHLPTDHDRQSAGT